jgi:hypothetical protein
VCRRVSVFPDVVDLARSYRVVMNVSRFLMNKFIAVNFNWMIFLVPESINRTLELFQPRFGIVSPSSHGDTSHKPKRHSDVVSRLRPTDCLLPPLHPVQIRTTKRSDSNNFKIQNLLDIIRMHFFYSGLTFAMQRGKIRRESVKRNIS